MQKFCMRTCIEGIQGLVCSSSTEGTFLQKGITMHILI